MTSVLSAVKESVRGAKETKKVHDLRHETTEPRGEAMCSDHGTRIGDTENWCVGRSRRGAWAETRGTCRLRVMGDDASGPALLEDQLGREKMHRFDHERIPERVVHARGTGAHGYFRVHDDRLAKYTCAAVLTDATRTTPVFVRFSTVQGSRGSADTGAPAAARGARCCSRPFFLASARRARVCGQVLHGRGELGSGWVCAASRRACSRADALTRCRNNIPVFFIQDGMQFPDFVHAVKPEPHNEASCRDSRGLAADLVDDRCRRDRRR